MAQCSQRNCRFALPLLALLIAAGPVLGPQGLVSSALAAAASPQVEVTDSRGLVIGADLRSEYLKGQKLIVHVVVRNPTAETLNFPDLSKRPWLLEFALIEPDGRVQLRQSTAPERDGGQQWSIGPRGQKRVMLEMPSGEALKKDSFDLELRLKNGEEKLKIGPTRVKLVVPAPFAAAPEELLIDESRWMIPWVHRRGSGAELYLTESPLHGGRGSLFSYHLASFARPIHPYLSSSRPADASARWILWQEDARRLSYARLDGVSLRAAPESIGLPYPSWSLLGRAVTDAKGLLHVPLWIPAPDGIGGEVRVASLGERGAPTLRKVASFDQLPVASAVADASGTLRLLLLSDGDLDLYTVEAGASDELPARGHRVVTRPPPRADADDSSPPFPLAGATFGILPQREQEPGGMSIFVWTESQGDTRSILGGWLAFDGRAIAAVDGVVVPRTWAIRQVIPVGYQALAVVARDPKGQGWLFRSGVVEPLSLGALSDLDTVRINRAGQAYLLELGSEFQIRKIGTP